MIKLDEDYFNKFLGTERKLFFFLKKKESRHLPPDKFTTTGRVIFHESNSNYKLMQFFKWSENEKKRRRSIDNIC